MNPPFSSNPKSAFSTIILLETSTLPTLVLITEEFVFVTISSIEFPEFKQVTILEFGFLFKRYFANNNADLSPDNNFPALSQNILRSPSPSKAIPMSALLFKTVEESSSRLYGVGSEPLPEKFPSICSLIIITSQPSCSHNFPAVIICAPFPRSNTTLNFLDLILSTST